MLGALLYVVLFLYEDYGTVQDVSDNYRSQVTQVMRGQEWRGNPTERTRNLRFSNPFGPLELMGDELRLMQVEYTPRDRTEESELRYNSHKAAHPLGYMLYPVPSYPKKEI